MRETVRGNGVTIPEELIDRVMATQDLSELKAVLMVLRLSGASTTHAVASSDLQGPRVARMVAGPHNPEGAQKRTQRAVDRAVANGTLLRVSTGTGMERRDFLLAASNRARSLVDRLRANEADSAREMGLPDVPDVSVYRPNIYAFYEQHLGPLTPLVADQLRDAERSYPRGWIEGAIVAAADSNARNWRYIETVLSHWEETGAPSGVSGSASDLS